VLTSSKPTWKPKTATADRGRRAKRNFGLVPEQQYCCIRSEHLMMFLAWWQLNNSMVSAGSTIQFGFPPAGEPTPRPPIPEPPVPQPPGPGLPPGPEEPKLPPPDPEPDPPGFPQPADSDPGIYTLRHQHSLSSIVSRSYWRLYMVCKMISPENLRSSITQC